VIPDAARASTQFSDTGTGNVLSQQCLSGAQGCFLHTTPKVAFAAATPGLRAESVTAMVESSMLTGMPKSLRLHAILVLVAAADVTGKVVAVPSFSARIVSGFTMSGCCTYAQVPCLPSRACWLQQARTG
jgi:hypothetical protein